MRRYSLRANRFILAIAATLMASLGVATAAAQAIVVTDTNTNGTTAGVALVPSLRGSGASVATALNPDPQNNDTKLNVENPSGPCADPAASTEADILRTGTWPVPALSAGLAEPICWQGGPVLHANETFALEWEGQSPTNYWGTTKKYVQDFLQDVAGASGQRVNPYSDTTQYWDSNQASGRAAYNSIFGGGCDDNGTANCKFGSITGSGAGNPLPTAPGTCGATVPGDNIDGGSFAGGPVSIPNNLCITDSDIQSEVTSLVQNDGLIAHAKTGYPSLVTVLTPPGVVVCLDSTKKLCSSNSLVAPPPPVLSSADTGGHVTAGTYQVVVTYYDSGTSKESAPSAPASITTGGSTATITIATPPDHTGFDSWYAYVTGPNGSVYHLQSSTADPSGVNSLGQALTLTDPPSGGPAPQTDGATFCSYHSKDPQVIDPQTGRPLTYVVQPWSAFTICDEPDVPAVTPYTAPSVIEKSAGQRLVSPLSQSSMAAIVNPQVTTGWFGLDGLEIDDQNACQPLGHGLDTFTFGTSGEGNYYLQRESNNTSVVNNDPWTYNGCLPSDVLDPTFAVPGLINQGDTVDLDGSATASSLGIPNANYSWEFSDGGHASGPSVTHTYNKAGTFTVTLTVTDRGVNSATVSQTIQVMGPDGQPGPTTPTTPTTPAPSTGGGSGGSTSGPALNVHLQMLPQSLKSVLSKGIAVRVNSNRAANGIATVWITRAAAKKAHIKTGKARVIRIGIGTISSVKNGTVTLRLHLSRSVIKKLHRLRHVTITVRLALVSSGNHRISVVAAGRY